MKKKLFIFSVLTSLLVMWATVLCMAAEYHSPSSVTLTPRSASFTVDTTVQVVLRDNLPMVDLLVPESAQYFTVGIVDNKSVTIRRWDVVPVTLSKEAQGRLGQDYEKLLVSKDRLQGEIAALNARIGLWTNLPKDGLSQEQLQSRDALLTEVLPAITLALGEKERALKDIEGQLSQLPAKKNRAKCVRIIFNAQAKEGSQVRLCYTYTLKNTWWRPVYRINAQDSGIDVTLEAQITQYSGMDWKKTQVVLVLQETGQREPAPISPWMIVARQEEDGKSMGRARFDSAAPMAASSAKMKQAAPNDAERADTDDIPVAFTSEHMSGWTLPAVNIPEGVFTLPVLQEVWKDPLQRLARPSRDPGKIWITAKHTFTGGMLPPGKAMFLLDGSPMGEGIFSPEDGSVTMHFGSDPLMTMVTEPDTRKTSKSGFIDKRRIWNWGWTYTLRNNRNKAVQVRVEEPAPRATDKAIAVKIESTPQAQNGPRNTLFWEVEVPATGTANVRHAVTVDAPQEMSVFVGR